MSPEAWERCKQIFCDALDLGPEERIILLDRECGEDAELRSEVIRMLGADVDEGASPLDVNAAERVLGNAPLAEFLLPGDVLGRYRVIRHIGQGGTSLVYLAEHVGLNSPRRFAIKLIAWAFIAGQRERFDRECEILATLQHPNIARILDRGVTDTGWPYLVMDYIDGVPIHKYCSEHKLAPPEIVRVMQDCCRAVQYFHGNNIVHCDLKPANILVDASGSPRILDFGIARLMEPDRITRTGLTTRGIRPLTPNYASPEQLAGSPLTAATDIYSLGVVLYESLAGGLPFEYPDAPWPEISRKIAEKGPPPPSKTRAKSLNRDDTQYARQLRGDLDAIVLKMLAYEPKQRYDSIDGLSADLNQYLAGESVKARHSSWAERAGKLAKHRKRALAEAVAISVAVILAVGFSSWRANQQEGDRQKQYVAELRAVVDPLIMEQSERLPESSAERTALANQLTATIESVSPRVSQHPEMVTDLADALLRVAQLLGNPYGVSLGRMDEARANYRLALDLMGRQDNPRSRDIRAMAALGIGDTYSHPAFDRDPEQAAEWYQKALVEITPIQQQFGHTAALAHSRFGMILELLGDAEEARAHYREALELLPQNGPLPQPPFEAVVNLVERAGMEPSGGVRDAAYREALDLLSQLLKSDPHDIRAWHVAIEAHLFAGLNDLQLARAPDAERDFAMAAGLAQQVLFRDSENIQERRELAVALRRGAMVPALGGGPAQAEALREQAADALLMTFKEPALRPVDEQAAAACPISAERLIEGGSTAALSPGNLLIGNQRAGGTTGALLEFSPRSKEMSVLAPAGYLADVADIAVASRTEIYVVDRRLAGSGGVVRLRHSEAGWLEKTIACGGLLRAPVSVAYSDRQLVVTNSNGYSSQLIGIDPDTGRQTLLTEASAFGAPGKMIRARAGEFFISLFWPGEGGPAEIASFNAKTHKLSIAARYGLLEDPVALGMTPAGDLIAADRQWTGSGGQGYILRIGTAVRILCRKPELARVTAVAALSETEAWYSTAAAPFSSSPALRAKLFKLDLVTGETAEETIKDERILADTHALVRVD